MPPAAQPVFQLAFVFAEAAPNGVLTVVMADPGNLQALDDLRNFLGIQQVQAVLAPPRQIEEAIKTAYSGKQDNIADLIAELNADTTLQINRKETSIDLDSLMEVVDAALFHACLRAGIGPGKAYGYGLLSLAQGG